MPEARSSRRLPRALRERPGEKMKSTPGVSSREPGRTLEDFLRHLGLRAAPWSCAVRGRLSTLPTLAGSLLALSCRPLSRAMRAMRLSVKSSELWWAKVRQAELSALVGGAAPFERADHPRRGGGRGPGGQWSIPKRGPGFESSSRSKCRALFRRTGDAAWRACPCTRGSTSSGTPTAAEPAAASSDAPALALARLALSLSERPIAVVGLVWGRDRPCATAASLSATARRVPRGARASFSLACPRFAECDRGSLGPTASPPPPPTAVVVGRSGTGAVADRVLSFTLCRAGLQSRAAPECQLGPVPSRLLRRSPPGPASFEPPRRRLVRPRSRSH